MSAGFRRDDSFIILPQVPQPTFFPDAARFRAWLEANHATAAELSVGFRKKATGQPSIAVDADLTRGDGWFFALQEQLSEPRFGLDETADPTRPVGPPSQWRAVPVASPRTAMRTRTRTWSAAIRLPSVVCARSC